MDVSQLEFQREVFKRELLPFVKPAPESDTEREELIDDLKILFYTCVSTANNRTGLLQGIVDRVFPEYGDKAKSIRKAATLLEKTGLDFQEIILELRKSADNLEGFFNAWATPSRDTARRQIVLERCREFLLSHGKHAGITDTVNSRGEKVQGMAVLLAQAVLELATRNPKTGRGIYVSAQALSKYAKRARDKKAKKSE